MDIALKETPPREFMAFVAAKYPRKELPLALPGLDHERSTRRTLATPAVPTCEHCGEEQSGYRLGISQPTGGSVRQKSPVRCGSGTTRTVTGPRLVAHGNKSMFLVGADRGILTRSKTFRFDGY